MKNKKITKKALEDKCKEIRDNNLWKPLSSEDQEFLTNEVFRYHPKWESSVNKGIKCIIPEVNKQEGAYNSKCFFIHYNDGTKEDISFHWALTHRPKNIQQSFKVPDDLNADDIRDYCNLPNIKTETDRYGNVK